MLTNPPSTNGSAVVVLATNIISPTFATPIRGDLNLSPCQLQHHCASIFKQSNNLPYLRSWSASNPTACTNPWEETKYKSNHCANICTEGATKILSPHLSKHLTSFSRSSGSNRCPRKLTLFFSPQFSNTIGIARSNWFCWASYPQSRISRPKLITVKNPECDGNLRWTLAQAAKLPLG